MYTVCEKFRLWLKHFPYTMYTSDLYTHTADLQSHTLLGALLGCVLIIHLLPPDPLSEFSHLVRKGTEITLPVLSGMHFTLRAEINRWRHQRLTPQPNMTVSPLLHSLFYKLSQAIRVVTHLSLMFTFTQRLPPGRMC